MVTPLCAIYSLDIVQRNPETLFLTKEGKASYLRFKDDFNEMQYLIAVHKCKSSAHLGVHAQFLS
jgi:hypothetical protein